jgi:hypothetical protein
VKVVGPVTVCLSPLLSRQGRAAASLQRRGPAHRIAYQRYVAKYSGSWHIAYVIPFPAAPMFDAESFRYRFTGTL